MDITQVLIHPIRGRIMQHLTNRQQATAGDLALVMPDVPRTTLYRHMRILLEHEILDVVAEARVRGSVERTYALNKAGISRHNTLDNLLHNAFSFLINIYADFAKYLESGRADPMADKLFLTHRSLLLNDAEFDRFLNALGELLLQHQGNEPGNDRKPRSISLISSPVIEEEDTNGKGDRTQTEE